MKPDELKQIIDVIETAFASNPNQPLGNVVLQLRRLDAYKRAINELRQSLCATE